VSTIKYRFIGNKVTQWLNAYKMSRIRHHLLQPTGFLCDNLNSKNRSANAPYPSCTGKNLCNYSDTFMRLLKTPNSRLATSASQIVASENPVIGMRYW